MFVKYLGPKRPVLSRRWRRRVRYGLPVWAVAVMALAMLLRVVSGLPAISTPHHHGDVFHTHEAGGVAHDHPDDHDHGHDGTPVLHRHGDGPYHVDGVDHAERHAAARPARNIETNDFPVYIPVRWPPEAYRKAAEDHANEDPAAPEGAPEEHHSPYFCAAAAVALEAAPVAEPPVTACDALTLPLATAHPRRIVVGPRQSRAPPAAVLFQNV